MNTYLTYGIIFVILLILELVYFKIADRFNIIDKPNERSSHSSVVLRGGGIIFLLGLWIWWGFALAGAFPESSIAGDSQNAAGFGITSYLWFLVSVTLIAGVSFIDDIRSLPDSVRLLLQFVAMIMMFYQLDILHWNMWWIVAIALIVFVGAADIINFMDGVNGITGAYAMASLIPLALLNVSPSTMGFVDQSLIYVVILADIVFCIFNFRPKGKAKCFAGDVGSIGMAYILLFLIGLLILATSDVTYLIFLLVYGVDGVLTICHRILLHENLGEAHRKHAYQLMANELKIGHVKVASFYALLQLLISLGFVYICPVLASSFGLSLVAWHWIYLIIMLMVLALAYTLFMKKYYHLHEEYLASLKK